MESEGSQGRGGAVRLNEKKSRSMHPEVGENSTKINKKMLIEEVIGQRL